MNNDLRSLIDDISKKIQRGEIAEFNWNRYRTNYHIFCMPPNIKKGINIPSIVIVPQNDTIYNQIVLEVNNCDTRDLSEMIINGGETGEHLMAITKESYAPMVIPLLPAMTERGIYFQQLSKECFELPDTDWYYRIDEQVIRIINEVKAILKNKIRNTMFEQNIFKWIFIFGCICTEIFINTSRNSRNSLHRRCNWQYSYSIKRYRISNWNRRF